MKNLRELYQVLKSEFPDWDGTKYGFNENGARLGPGWLLQTPDIWGMEISKIPVQPLRDPKEPGIDPDFRLPVCTEATENCNCKELKATVAKPGDKPRKLCLGHSTSFVDEFYSMIIQAEEKVYISTLIPGPNENFLAAVRNAITYLGHKGKPITILMLVGHSPGYLRQKEADRLRDELTRDLKDVAGARITLKVRVFGSAMEWNHSKILVVDEKMTLTGGHNYYQDDYLQEFPVFDLSMKFSGAAAAYSNRFFTIAWNSYDTFTDPSRAEAVYPVLQNSDTESTNSELILSDLPFSTSNAKSSPDHQPENTTDLIVPALAVGRLGLAWEEEPGERALLYLIDNASESIKISQMSIGFKVLVPGTVRWPEKLMNAMARFIVNKKKDIYIVQSDEKAKGLYYPQQSLKQLEDALFIRAKAIPGVPPDDKLKELFGKHLHLGAFHFTNALEWPNKTGFANHAKFIMVDDEQFYIGSQNMYVPAPWPTSHPRLYEFGCIIESKAAAKIVLDQYWNNLWKYSAYWMKIRTGKKDYAQGETVDVWVEVNGATQDDSIVFRYDNGRELWWTFTGNERNGRITNYQYLVGDQFLRTGKEIRIDYLLDGNGERRIMGSTSFHIMPIITVTVKTDKDVYQPHEPVRISWTIVHGVPFNDAIVIENKDGQPLHSFNTSGITSYEWVPAEQGQLITLHYIYDRPGKNWSMAKTSFTVKHTVPEVRTNAKSYKHGDNVEFWVEVSNNRKNDAVRLLNEKGVEIWRAPTLDIRSGKIAAVYTVGDTFLQSGQKITLQYLQYGLTVTGSNSFEIRPMIVTLKTQYPEYQAGTFAHISWATENGTGGFDDIIVIKNREGQLLHSFPARNGQNGWRVIAMSEQFVTLTYIYNPTGKNWPLNNIHSFKVRNGITTVRTNKAEYSQGEKVEILVEVAFGYNPNRDKVRFFDQNKKEIWWADTNGIIRGKLEATYPVTDKFLQHGQEIEAQYWEFGTRVEAKSTFKIKPMQVTITPNKPVYKVGERVTVSVKVENGKPYDDSIQFRLNNKEEGYLFTHGETNGRLKDQWEVPDRLRGKTLTIVYIYGCNVGGVRWDIANTTIKIE